MIGLNNPVPSNLRDETRKAASILASFVKPNQVLGADQVIPPGVLKRAKGLAVITVFKAGFLFSGRAGSGVIVARLKDGTWSAPSAIGIAGAGAGGMVGVELTDFVFILNTADAVNSFCEFGTITLGGNVSVSAGPLGRSAEAAASASVAGVSAVFSYSKSKGLFAGISVEGSMIVERREANRKVYGDNCTAKMVLSGKVRPPVSFDPLFRVLESKAFNYSTNEDYEEDEFYDDIPDSFGEDDLSSSRANTRSTRRVKSRRGYYDDYSDDEFTENLDDDDDDDDDDDSVTPDLQKYCQRSYRKRSGDRRRRWSEDSYDHSQSPRLDNDVGRISEGISHARISDSENRRPPSSNIKAVALYKFAGEQDGDLAFKKGDVITVLRRSESQNDWWTGRVNGKEGIFPANYVELV